MKGLLITKTIHLAPLRKRRRGLLLSSATGKLLIDLFRDGEQLVETIKESQLGALTRITK